MFALHKTDGDARRGTLTTAHGEIQTPMFMPVGTRATVKTLDARDLHELGAQIILGNTYHLNLRPGPETIRAAGGLHAFMGWDKPILTDSGGFQVFSLAKMAKIKEDGVAFQSHIDGSPLFLGPKEAMSIQRDLGSDIAMVFDDCPPYPAEHERVAAAVERTARWAAECREQPRADGQLVFGIVQGGCHADLRERSATDITALDFDGHAIGGLSVGEPEPEMLAMAAHTAPMLPANKPRYAMGLGTPAQLVELVARGVDIFDCVLPTRLARNGTAFTYDGAFALKGAAYKEDFTPIEAGCDCFTCRHHTRAYVRHLLNVDELLGLRLLTLHNLRLYLRLMADIRKHIEAGTFGKFRGDLAARYTPSTRVAAQRKNA
ncbi:MAG: tRNA guanosine(34) transglycosylase Tgt [Verrucomicrobia subdivision 3 bacterium]|nr:tRNA guanosine(34) transglycosylase Tgt [Limisphaerales bacterium]